VAKYSSSFITPWIVLATDCQSQPILQFSYNFKYEFPIFKKGLFIAFSEELIMSINSQKFATIGYQNI